MGINGFGRIGRAAFKAALELGRKLSVVAINDITDTATLAHLLSYDSAYGRYEKRVSARKDALVVDDSTFPVFAEREPGKLPWGKLKVDVVLECTGLFLTKALAGAHVVAGARRVIVSAPPKDDSIPTYLLGVNDQTIDPKARIISNASCTTNSVAPVAAILEEAFGVKKAAMTTVHAYTADQNLVDGPHHDLRRARASAVNIVPTTTGAAVSTGRIIPKLSGRFDGLAMRVPVITGSLSDITLLLKRGVTVSEVNRAFVHAAKSKRYKGIVAVTEEPIVSTDIIKNPHSAIVDLSLTRVIDGDLVKVVAWYDNEWGYAHRLVELALIAGR